MRFYTILGFLLLAFLVGNFWFGVLVGHDQGRMQVSTVGGLAAVLICHVVFIILLRDQLRWMKDNPGGFLGEFSSSAAGIGGLVGFGVLVVIGRGARAIGKGATDWTILGWVFVLVVSAVTTVLVYRGVKSREQASRTEDDRQD